MSWSVAGEVWVLAKWTQGWSSQAPGLSCCCRAPGHQGLRHQQLQAGLAGQGVEGLGQRLGRQADGLRRPGLCQASPGLEQHAGQRQGQPAQAGTGGRRDGERHGVGKGDKALGLRMRIFPM